MTGDVSIVPSVNLFDPISMVRGTLIGFFEDVRTFCLRFHRKSLSFTRGVKIKNQQLTSDENGSYPSLYYGFRFKDHNARIGFWDYDPPYFVLPSIYGGYYKASDSDFTSVSLSLEGYHFPSGQIDIQAVALVGNQYPTNIQNGTVYGFEGIICGWSNTQTLTIGENLPSSIALIAIVVAIVAAVILVSLGNFKKLKR